jgi:hypothetical protein
MAKACVLYIIAQHMINFINQNKQIGQHTFEMSLEKAIKIYSKHLGAIAAGSQCSVLSAHFLSGGCLISTQRERCINILLGRRQSARCTRERERQRPCCNAKNKTTCSRIYKYINELKHGNCAKVRKSPKRKSATKEEYHRLLNAALILSRL